MKLIKLIISNFRGLKGSNVIDFTNSNIIFLIGQNNIGKSSFLRAYEFFIDPKQIAKTDDFNNYDYSTPIVIEGIFELDEEDSDDPDLKEKKEPNWIEKWVDENGFVKVRKTWSKPDRTFAKETYSPRDASWIENGFGGLHTKLTKYTPTPIAINAMEDQASLEEKVNKLIQDDFIKKVRSEYPEEFKNLIDGVRKLQERITGSEAVEKLNLELNKHFQEVFAELTLKIQPAKEENIRLEDAFKKNHSILVERAGTERKETFLQNGHGVIRQALFNFLTFLKRENEGNKKQYIILFEEPELFLHPKIAFKLRQSLYELSKNSPYQILCATHSPLMIDISQPHSSLIRVIKNTDEETQTYQVGETLFGRDEEAKKWVQMVNRFNPHICEAFYADKVLLVEGDTETIVYRDLLTRFFPDEEIFVLNTGSKMNIPFFQEILTAFHIEHYIIHDSDDKEKKAAWTINTKIWENVQASNNLSKRYVHIHNFEDAHGITVKSDDGKPLTAYNFAQTIKDVNTKVPCLEWLKDIIYKNGIIHDPQFIEDKV